MVNISQNPFNNDDLFEFPCEFPIKILGKAAEDFELLVVELVRRHCHDLKKSAVTMRSSKGGKYVSVTVIITAQSRAHLDALYMDLSSHERVKMVL
jgi:putative lipoic acid-binding regulatory protein